MSNEDGSEGQSSLTPHDVFDFVSLYANEVNLAEARLDQKNSGRQKFVNELLSAMRSYNEQHAVEIGEKPEGYYGVLKSVLSSKTNELMDMIAACQHGDFNSFVSIVKEFDFETLRRMRAIPESARSTVLDLDTYNVLSGVRADVFTTLEAQGERPRDVRSAAAEARRSPRWRRAA